MNKLNALTTEQFEELNEAWWNFVFNNDTKVLPMLKELGITEEEMWQYCADLDD